MSGASGFLGSHLVDSLLSEGHEVIGVDNFFTGHESNILHLKGNPNFSLMRHDVTSPLFVEVDEIYNLASPASPSHYQLNPVQTLKTNVLGAIEMLELAKRLRVPIFQASTSEVYGDPLVHPQRENYFGNVNPIGPRACYDEGKRAAETLFYDYHRQHGVDVRVARIFNTYGPRMSVGDGRVVSSFIVHALNEAPIVVYGDGLQSRSFCYVDDLTRGIMLLMKKDVFSPVNLGNPQELSIVQLADLIISLTGSSSQIVFAGLPEDDPQRRRPDISLARNLGWEPEIPLIAGLERTISWFKTVI